MQGKHTGARNELAAVVWLLESGYEVFRNVSQHGLIDVLAIKDGETLLLDIKSGSGGYLTDQQIDAGVKMLMCRDRSFLILNGNKREERLCKGCNRPIPLRNRKRLWCSNTCKNRATAERYKARRAAESILGGV